LIHTRLTNWWTPSTSRVVTSRSYGQDSGSPLAVSTAAADAKVPNSRMSAPPSTVRPPRDDPLLAARLEPVQRALRGALRSQRPPQPSCRARNTPCFPPRWRRQVCLPQVALIWQHITGHNGRVSHDARTTMKQVLVAHVEVGTAFLCTHQLPRDARYP
jgi:hypothetical protein